MNPDDLNDAVLDYWTARAEGYEAELREMYGQHYCRIDVQHVGYQIYCPTQNSQIVAEIAFRRCYTIYPHPCLDENGRQQTHWLAEAQMNKKFHGMFRDLQPRVAICRLRVAEAIAERVLDVRDFVGVIGEKP